MAEKKDDDDISRKMQSTKGRPQTLTNKVDNANIKNWVNKLYLLYFYSRKSKNGFLLHFLKI